MDLLLDLAERQRIDLGRVSILTLAEQFAAELRGRLRLLPLERRADWVVLATRLVLLRARLLFPASPEAAAVAERDAAAELRRLDERTRIRAAVVWLQARPVLGRDVFARPARGRDPRTASYMALMEACLPVLRGRGVRPHEAPVYRPAVLDLHRVADAVARIRARLAEHPEGGELAGFLPLLPADAAGPNRPLQARSAVASTLMAGLELAREGALTLHQETPWGRLLLVSVTESRSDQVVNAASKRQET